MIEKIKKMKDNKILKIVGNLIYGLLVLFVVLLLLVVILQRFSNNTITLGGFRIFNIATESMVPVYNVGDVIIDKKVDPKDLKPGDDISYLGKERDFAGKIVTHRIESIEKQEDGTYKIITKGVANAFQDPEITDSQIQGKVIYKFITLSFISKIIRKSLVMMYVLIFIPIGIIIFINLRKLFSGKDDQEEDDDNSEDEND